eukprot:snap_masked-scaffold_1-processed-gene-3.25-mRNA-1 protein AED:1.00 eAED:1.00 QI:0/-1/0/0/-1/1/1/0/777
MKNFSFSGDQLDERSLSELSDVLFPNVKAINPYFSSSELLSIQESRDAGSSNGLNEEWTNFGRGFDPAEERKGIELGRNKATDLTHSKEYLDFYTRKFPGTDVSNRHGESRVFMGEEIKHDDSSEFSTFTEDSTTYRLEFLYTDKWKPEYQRNNRNGGLKNIRCFPYCGDKHYSSGFCGMSLMLKLSIQSKENIFNSPMSVQSSVSQIPTLPRFLVIAHISLENAAKMAPRDQGLDKEDDRVLHIGQVISRSYLESRLRTKDKPFHDFWPGDIKTSQHFSRGNNDSVLVYEFNREKRGWHYGWTSNKYISRSNHVVRAYVLKQVQDQHNAAWQGQLFKVVHVEMSKPFKLYSRKPKRSSEVMKQEKKDSKLEKNLSTKKPKKSFGSIAGVGNSRRVNPFSIDTGLLRSASNELTAFMQKLLYFNQDELKKVGEAEETSEECKTKVEVEDEGMFSFGGFFEEKTSENLSNTQKEVVALRAFTAFLISHEEDLTEQIQARLKALSFDEIKTEKGDSCADINTKTEFALKLAKTKFNEFLSSFDNSLNVDFYEKFSSNEWFVEGNLSSKMLNILPEGPGSSLDPTRSRNLSSAKVARKKFITDKGTIENFLSKLEGQWKCSQETLLGYDKIYTKMNIPYALRQCYICITESCQFKYASKKLAKNQIFCLYNPKLFSTGVVKYTVDGKYKAWPLASPLINTEHDAIGMRAFIRRNPETETHEFHIEHIYRHFKMLRVLKCVESDNCSEILGYVKLFEKDFDVEGNVEWNQIEITEIKLLKV